MPDIKSAVQKQFGSVAENYRLSAVHSRGADLERMVELAALRGSERVLDAGCGAGHTAAAFAPQAGSVVALDFTPQMLEQVEHLARERSLTNLTTQIGDVEAIPFGDQSFDIVTSRYSAHHYPHPWQAVAEIARVLRPGGVLLLSDVMAADDPTQDTFLQTLELLRDPSHVRDYRASEWLEWLHAAGLHAEVEMMWQLRLEFAPWVQRIGTPEQNAAMIRALFDGAPAEVRSAFEIDSEHNFTIPCGLIRAVKHTEQS